MQEMYWGKQLWGKITGSWWRRLGEPSACNAALTSAEERGKQRRLGWKSLSLWLRLQWSAWSSSRRWQEHLPACVSLLQLANSTERERREERRGKENDQLWPAVYSHPWIHMARGQKDMPCFITSGAITLVLAAPQLVCPFSRIVRTGHSSNCMGNGWCRAGAVECETI